jgi:hypothetical protein
VAYEKLGDKTEAARQFAEACKLDRKLCGN